MKETKFIGWSDTHVPYFDDKAVKCALKILESYQPDEVVILGDFIDGQPVSHHNRNKLREREGLRLASDFEAANHLLDRIQERTKKVTFLFGNHENFVDTYIEEHPELDGMINVEIGLNLKQRNIKFFPYNYCYKIGKLHFTHGAFVGQNHARKHAEAFGRSIVYGHTHTVQSYIHTSPIDVEDRHIAMSVGCLAQRNPAYMKNKPNSWVHAIAVGTVRGNGSFNCEPLIISRGVASYGGETFSWK